MSSFEGSPVGLCIKAFLDDLANDVNGLLSQWVNNREAALDQWFEQPDRRCSDDPDVRQEARAILLAGDFRAAQEHLMSLGPPPEAGVWLAAVTPTIWIV